MTQLESMIALLDDAGYVQYKESIGDPDWEAYHLDHKEYAVVTKGGITLLAFGPGRLGEEYHFTNFQFDTVSGRLLSHGSMSEIPEGED